MRVLHDAVKHLFSGFNNFHSRENLYLIPMGSPARGEFLFLEYILRLKAIGARVPSTFYVHKIADALNALMSS
jgi:hypothetical protein